MRICYVLIPEVDGRRIADVDFMETMTTMIVGRPILSKVLLACFGQNSFAHGGIPGVLFALGRMLAHRLSIDKNMSTKKSS